MKKYLSKEHTTICKGIAIIIIIICHLSALMLSNNIARITTPLGGIGVSIFLFLSGYGLNESYKKNGTNKYWFKKIINVIIPYIITFIIYLLINIHKLNILESIKLFFTIKDANNYYYWYIGYQIICYIVYFLAIKFNKCKYVILTFSFIIFFILFNEIRAEQSLSFLLGVIVSDYPKRKKQINKNIVTYSTIIVGILMLTLKQFPIARTLDEIPFKLLQLSIKLPLSIGLINIIFNLLKNKYGQKIKNIINRIGDNSYELFLSHGIAIISFEYFENNMYNIIIFIVITIALTILLKTIKTKIKYILLERK